MADIRINALATTATTPASDDYLALDGTAQGTRKILATNIANNVTDVILGTSGPSVKSSLSARAPRQGLVFDGTGYGTFSAIPAFGTGDFTYAAWIYVPATVTSYGPGLIGGGTNSFTLRVFNNFKLQSTLIDIADNAQSTSTVKAGAWNFVTYRRSGTSGYYGINGVEDAAITDSRNYSAGCTLVGQINVGYGTNYMWNGSIAGSLVYNRALSASEVVALYEAGAPAGADYPSKAAGVTMNSSAWTNIGYTSLTSANGGTFTAVKASGDGYAILAPAAPAIKKGTKIKVSGVLTLNNGKTVKPSVYIDEAGASLQSINVASGASFSYELTAVTNAATSVTFTSNGDADYTISSLVITSLGLLLAPDAAQAGGGLTWYDTSGNAANITLPASGVSWNVPSSLKTATGWTYNGTLTGTKITASSTDSSGTVLQVDTSATAYGRMGGSNSMGWVANTQHIFSSGGGETMRLNASGNLLLKADGTDSSNGKLQLATHTTSAGGIGFGTELSLYRKDASTLVFQPGGGSPYKSLLLYGDSANSGLFNSLASFEAVYFDSANHAVKLATNGFTALTLDSSQNATFAGQITASGISHKLGSGGTGSANALLTIDGSSASSYGPYIVLQRNSTNKWQFGTYSGINGGTSDDFLLYNPTAANEALKIAAATSNATFAGSIAIGNTVNTVSPTSPNRTITMVIGGTTYYIHAKTTND